MSNSKQRSGDTRSSQESSGFWGGFWPFRRPVDNPATIPNPGNGPSEPLQPEFVQVPVAAVPLPLIVLAEGITELARSPAAMTLLSDLPAEILQKELRQLPVGNGSFSVALADGRVRHLHASTAGAVLHGQKIQLIGLTDTTALNQGAQAQAEMRRRQILSDQREASALADLSHDLRTPLNGLFGFLQLLAATNLDRKQRDHLERIERSAEAMLLAIDQYTEAPQRTDSATSPPRCSRILLVEDDDVSRLLAQTLLEQDGHQVVVAGTGPEAVAAAETDDFDLILMDIRLPGFGGAVAAGRIRALTDDRAATVPILAMTANVLPDQLARYREAGMDGSITKPLDRERLRAAVTQYSRPSAVQFIDSKDDEPTAISDTGSGLLEVIDGLTDDDIIEPASVLDRTVLDGHLSILGPGRVGHVIDSFLRSGPACSATIADAVADRDLPGLAKAAHKLGSGALTVGLTTLAALARQIEADAKAGRDELSIAAAQSLPAVLQTGLRALQTYRSRLNG